MDGQRFDELTRALVSGTSRRRVVGGLVGAAVGALGLRRSRGVAAQGCGDYLDACFNGGECCSGVCDIPAGRRRGKCTCPEPCNGVCCGPDQSCSNDQCVDDFVATGQPVAAAWAAVTEAEALAAWTVPNDFAPVVGHRFTLRGAPRGAFDGMLHGEVVEVETQRRIVVDLWGGPLKQPSTVEVRFEATGDGSRLRLIKLAGPEPCTAAALTLGRGWQDRLLKGSLPRHLDARSR